MTRLRTTYQVRTRNMLTSLRVFTKCSYMVNVLAPDPSRSRQVPMTIRVLHAPGLIYLHAQV